MTLSELRVAELLAALGARTPAPASGAAAALTGALGAALVELAARFAGDDEAAARAKALAARLAELADEDGAAYAAFMAERSDATRAADDRASRSRSPRAATRRRRSAPACARSSARPSRRTPRRARRSRAPPRASRGASPRSISGRRPRTELAVLADGRRRRDLHRRRPAAACRDAEAVRGLLALRRSSARRPRERRARSARSACDDLPWARVTRIAVRPCGKAALMWVGSFLPVLPSSCPTGRPVTRAGRRGGVRERQPVDDVPGPGAARHRL